MRAKYYIYLQWDGKNSNPRQMVGDIRQLRIIKNTLVELCFGETPIIERREIKNMLYDIKITVEATIEELKVFIQELRKVRGLNNPEGPIIVKRASSD